MITEHVEEYSQNLQRSLTSTLLPIRMLLVVFFNKHVFMWQVISVEFQMIQKATMW